MRHSRTGDSHCHESSRSERPPILGRNRARSTIRASRPGDLGKGKNIDPLLQIPKFQVGKVGIEKKLENNLRGTAGVSRVEVNASGRVMRELNRAEGQSGANVHLTIDTKLQKFVSERLKDHSASAVFMNAKSGEILSLVSTPSYNPNKFVLGISKSDWDSIGQVMDITSMPWS